ncbi:MAG: hypothetical protein ACRDK1_02275 [Solirubrobacterales bacterium]
MDFTRLSQGEKIAGVSGILLILFMFVFKWFGLKFAGGAGAFAVSIEGSRNAWGSYGFTDIVLFITALAAIGLALLAASEGEIGLPVALSAIVAGLGILSVILIVISIISPPDLGANVSGASISHTRKIGVFLGLISAAAVAVGGYMAMQEEGTSFGDEAGRFGGGGDAGTGAPPPPPSDPPPSNPPPSA